MKPFFALILSFFYFFSPFNAFAADEIYHIQSPENNLTSYLEIFEDVSGTMTFEEVKGKQFKEVIIKNKHQPINMRFTSSAIWVKTSIQIDENGGSWMLEQNNNFINYLDLYLENTLIKGSVEHFSTGNMRPYNKRLYPYNNLVFPLNLESGNEYVLYVRYQSKQPLEIQLILRNALAFHKHAQGYKQLWGLYYGGFILVALYTLFLFLSIREATYFYYLSYVLSTLFMLAHIDGDLFKYFYPNNPELVFVIARCYIPLLLISVIQFAKSFLRIEKFSKTVDNAFSVIQLLTLCLFCSSPLISFGLYQAISFTFTGIVFILLIGVGFYVLKQGNKEALYYLIAWTPPAILVFLAGTRFIYTFPIDINHRLIGSMGFLIEMCLFSFALARRINLQKEELEGLVLERTKELKESQEQLVQSEKMASLAGLVVGVAHEINTPVGIGVTSSSHLVKETEEISMKLTQNNLKKSDLNEYFANAKVSSNLILNNFNRVSKLVNSFKMVSANQENFEQGEINVRKHLNDIFASLNYELQRQGHKAEINCPPNITIETYPRALIEVFSCLVHNSVKHGFTDKEEGVITLNTSRKGKEIVFTFKDDGVGIPKENVDMIFEPFFTTKRGDSCTGLGLHIVFNMVTHTLGGRISCDSIEGEGTTFFITLPQSLVAAS